MASDSYKFNLVGTEDKPFEGYVSSEDPTRLSPRLMVRGSQNVLLQNSGDITNREGIKRYDPADDTDVGVVSSFDWNDVNGNLLLIRVLATGELQFYREDNTTWYTLATYPNNTDFSYAKWWSIATSKEILVMCNGTTSLLAWGGALSMNGVGEVNDNNSIYFDGDVFITGFSFSTVPDEIVAISPYWSASNKQAAIVLQENPIDGSFLIGDISSTSLVEDEEFFIEFVDTLTAPSVPNAAQVLIGGSKEITLTNLYNLFQNPSSDTSTQIGFDTAALNTLLGNLESTIVPSLEAPTGESWSELGFVDNATIVVNDVTYPYKLVADRYLVDIDGTPPEGQFAYSGITESANTPDADFTNDFLLCLNNQLIACSYTSRVVHISFNEDYTLFTQSGDLVYGDPDQAILDEFPRGGTTRGDAAYIGAGQNAWYELAPNTPIDYVASQARTVYVKVTKFSGAGLTAPLGFNFVANLLEDIVFVDQQNQLRTLGIYRNIVQQKSPSLSLSVRRELEQEDFTGGCLKSIGEYTYLVAPISGKTYLYEIRDDVDDQGNIISKRHWQPPQIWNISRMSIVNGIPHGYSAQNPQLYQLFETGIYHDQTAVEEVQAPYISRARFAYRSSREEVMNFDKIYYEGYILPQSDLQAKTYYDYQGSTFIEEKVLSSQTINPTEFTNDETNLIGDSLVGDVTIGGSSLDPNYSITIPKFRVITNVTVKNCFEYQLEVFSEALDSQWALVALGGNEGSAKQFPVQLQI